MANFFLILARPSRVPQFYLPDTIHRAIGLRPTSGTFTQLRKSTTEEVRTSQRIREAGRRSPVKEAEEIFSMELAKELIQGRRLFTVSVFVDLQDYQLCDHLPSRLPPGARRDLSLADLHSLRKVT